MKKYKTARLAPYPDPHNIFSNKEGTTIKVTEPQAETFEEIEGHPVIPDGYILASRFQVIEIIGQGISAVVYAAVDLKELREVAIKVFRENENCNAGFEILMLQEIMSIDEDEFFVKFLCQFTQSRYVCCVYERLFKPLSWYQKSFYPTGLPIAELRPIARQLCRAVDCLHRNQLIHGDIKLDNMMLVRDPEQMLETRIRLIDFGLTTADYRIVRPKVVQSWPYRAPEVYLALEWSQPCDVWAIGGVLFRLYTGQRPIQRESTALQDMECLLGKIPFEVFHNDNDFFKKEKSLLKKSKHLSKKHKSIDAFRKEDTLEHVLLFDLMKRMLTYDPDDRITLCAALEHDFFTKSNESNA